MDNNLTELVIIARSMSQESYNASVDNGGSVAYTQEDRDALNATA